ncbi:RNA polymerase Rpb2, domain protein 3 domain protein, partial [mine drainage metagenome]
SETPEGPEVGLTRYLAIMAKITVGADESMVRKKLDEIMQQGSKSASKKQ